MSLIHLSSQGDTGATATRFSNYFPNPIIIAANSQVALVNVVLNPNGNIQIDDTNNLFYFSIGVITGVSPNPQHQVVVPEGEYLPEELAAELTKLLNAATLQQPYRRIDGEDTGGWDVTIEVDTTTNEPRAFKFTSTQNLQPDGTGFSIVDTFINIPSLEIEDQTLAQGDDLDGADAFLEVTKETSVENEDDWGSALVSTLGVYRGGPTKPYSLTLVKPYDNGGTQDWHTVVSGVIQSALVEDAEGNPLDFEANLLIGDVNGPDRPVVDIGVFVRPNSGALGDADRGHASVVVLNNTSKRMDEKTLLTTGTTYDLDGSKDGYLFKLEWQTGTAPRVYVSNSDDYSVFTHLYTSTKQYSSSLNQIYSILYQKEQGTITEIGAIYNYDVIPNVFQVPVSAILPDNLGGEDDILGAGDVYRKKTIRLSVGQLKSNQYLQGNGTLGETIGANVALIALTATDATFQEATYTTSGRPNFHGNLSTAHISLPNLPITSYLGKSSNIGKDIAIIPRFQQDATDPSDSLFYEAQEKNWIDLKNAEEITTNELTVGIKDSANKDLEGIHKPSAITILFRKK